MSTDTNAAMVTGTIYIDELWVTLYSPDYE